MSSKEDDFPPISKSSLTPIEQGNAELIQPRHPNFSKLNKLEQFEVFMEEMVNRDPRQSLDLFLVETGISKKEYNRLVKHEDYVNEMHDRSLREKFAPYLPAIYDAMGREAANGDMTAIKTALQSGGKIGPENMTLINQNLLNMGRDELEQELKLLMDEVKSRGEEE